MADTDTNTMLESVKLALAITVDSYDAELQDLINAALYDLKTNGVDALNMQTDALVVQAVKTYCRAHFHSPADYDKLLSAYEEQKGHLMNCTGYTVFPTEPKTNPIIMEPPDLTLPEGMTVIETEAFEGSSIRVVKLPATVTSIGVRAFADCYRLRQIEIPPGAQIAENAFENVASLTIFGYPGSPAASFAKNHGYVFASIGG